MQEIVSGINKNDEKTYVFQATGKGDFKFILNFGGSAISIKITSPDGKEIASQNVSKPPYVYDIKTPKAGKYTVTLKGTDIPQKNYPFVLTAAGVKGAVEGTVQTTSKGSNNSTTSALNNVKGKFIKAGIVTLIAIIAVTVLIIVIVALKKRNKKVAPVDKEASKKE